MVKLIFDQIWGDQKEAVLQACQMLDACDKETVTLQMENGEMLTLARADIALIREYIEF